MRPLEDARRDVLSAVRPLPVEATPLDDCVGLVLADDVIAAHDVPPFANSAMDGFAVRAADVAAPPVELPVLEDVRAGSVPTQQVAAGQAIKIMTGAPVPVGADAIVPVENTEPSPGGIRILESVEPGTSIRLAGGDVAAGSVVLGAGTALGPAHVALLAGVGASSPAVHRRPRVAIMSTGDELRPPSTETLEPGQIRDSNRPLLRACLVAAGATVLDLGIIGDDEGQLREALSRAAAEADAIATSGGVSMGEYDLVKAVLTELGGIEFWRVAMQPAKPFAFGAIDGVPLFGLPGNPVSVFVAFEQFMRPALRKMMGHTALHRPRIQGVMDEPVSTNPEKTVFVRVALGWMDGVPHARLSGGQSSNVLTALALADALAVVPVGVGNVSAGETVELEMIHWPAGQVGLF